MFFILVQPGLVNATLPSIVCGNIKFFFIVYDIKLNIFGVSTGQDIEIGHHAGLDSNSC